MEHKKASKHELKLVEVDRNSLEARSELIEFVNGNLVLGLPLEDDALKNGRVVMFWALHGSKKVGVSGYIPKTPFLAETAKTVIHPDCRGKGWGAVVSQAIEDEVRSRGFKKVVTTIYTSNLAMIFIKLKQGYFFEGFHRDHDRPGLHEYTLGKVLSDSN